MARKEKKFQINMSFSDFISRVIDTSEIHITKDKEIIKSKNNKTIVLHKKRKKE